MLITRVAALWRQQKENRNGICGPATAQGQNTRYVVTETSYLGLKCQGRRSDSSDDRQGWQKWLISKTSGGKGRLARPRHQRNPASISKRRKWPHLALQCQRRPVEARRATTSARRAPTDVACAGAARTLQFATRVSPEFDAKLRRIAERHSLLLVEIMEKALDL